MALTMLRTLAPQRRRVRLKNLRPGLFLSPSGELCLMTEYSNEAYIVSSGEAFWGGVPSREVRAELLVTPVDVH